MSAAARRLEVLEDLLQDSRLEKAKRLRRQLIPLARELESLAFGHFAHVILNLLLKRFQLFDITRLGKLGERFHIYDADLRRISRLTKLFEQPVDHLELFLDRQRLGHGHRRTAREIIFRRQFIDLVLLTQSLDQVQQLAGERRLLILDAIPQRFEVSKLLGLKLAMKRLIQRRRRLHLATQIDIRSAGAFLHPFGFIG